MLPVAEHLHHAARREHARDVEDEVPHEVVAGSATVAVLEQLDARRRTRCDDERRVRHDKVERLPHDRLEHRALAQLEVDLVERRIEPRERERRAGDVRAHDLPGVPGRVQRLDAAARAEVQDPADRTSRGHLREREGRAARTEDVVRLEAGTGCELAQVGGEPPVEVPCGVVRCVGPQVEPGAHTVRVDVTGQAEGSCAVEPEGGQRERERVARDRVAEEEHRGERCAAAVRVSGCCARFEHAAQDAARRQRLLAVQRVERERAEQRLDPGDRVVGSGEIGAQAREKVRDSVDVEDRRMAHRSILPSCGKDTPSEAPAPALTWGVAEATQSGRA